MKISELFEGIPFKEKHAFNEAVRKILDAHVKDRHTGIDLANERDGNIRLRLWVSEKTEPSALLSFLKQIRKEKIAANSMSGLIDDDEDPQTAAIRAKLSARTGKKLINAMRIDYMNDDGMNKQDGDTDRELDVDDLKIEDVTRNLTKKNPNGDFDLYLEFA